jgi:hypothetical protein
MYNILQNGLHGFKSKWLTINDRTRIDGKMTAEWRGKGVDFLNIFKDIHPFTVFV